MRYELEKQSGWEYRINNGDMKGTLVSFEYCTLGEYKGNTFMCIKSEEKTEHGICEREKYLLKITDMESYKVPRVLGNGYVTVPTSVECEDKHYDRVDVFYNTARETRFGGDWDENASYSGFTYNRYWNGWECPYFTKEVCEKIMSDSFKRTSETTWESEADGYKYWYDVETDTYMEQMPDDDAYPLGSPYDVNGVHAYDLGAGNWCWCEESEKGDEEDE